MIPDPSLDPESDPDQRVALYGRDPIVIPIAILVLCCRIELPLTARMGTSARKNGYDEKRWVSIWTPKIEFSRGLRFRC